MVLQSEKTKLKYYDEEPAYSKVMISAKDKAEISFGDILRSQIEISKTADVAVSGPFRTEGLTLINSAVANTERNVDISKDFSLVIKDRDANPKLGKLAEQFRNGDLDKLKDKPELKTVIEAYKMMEKYVDAHIGKNSVGATIAKADLREKLAGVVEAGKPVVVKPEAAPKQSMPPAPSKVVSTAEKVVESPKMAV